jgi:hypothetical protein
MSSRVRKKRQCGCGAGKVQTAARALVVIGRAELRGRINPLAYRKAWLAMCSACPSSQRHAGVLWCGEPLVDRSDDPDPTQRTCGCACREKARIAGSECPQGKHTQITVSARHT